MFSNARRRAWTSATIAATVVVLAALAAVPGLAVEPRYATIAAGETDVPLRLTSTFGPTCGSEEYDVVWAGRGMHGGRGLASLRLQIPGQPVAAHLYIVGGDNPGLPGKHYTKGDKRVRAVIRPAAGPRAVLNVPIAHTALDVFVNKVDITAHVREGLNRIRVSGYGPNDAGGVYAVAVYRAPGLPPVRIDLFEGADFAYYPLRHPFGPDSEAVVSAWAPEATDRAGMVWMAIAGCERGRGDEILMHTGAEDPALGCPCSDHDHLADVVQRQYRLERQDKRPLGNDRADRAGHLEALPGSISLEEDGLGVRGRRGFSRGAELDLFSKGFTLPAGHRFAAFQVQSENAEFGDSLVLATAATRLPVGCGVNPAPNITVTKAPKLTEGLPGLTVVFTFQVTAEGGNEALRDVTLADDPPLAITGPTGDDGDALLELGEVWTYTATATFNEVGEFPDVVTATGVGVESGIPVSAQDDALVRVTAPAPAFHIVKTADPVLVKAGEPVTYTYEVCNDGNVVLGEVVVTDDRFPGEVIGRVFNLQPGACDRSVTKTVAAPPCATPEIGLREGVCEGEQGRGSCFWPNIGTATWGVMTDDDDACITIQEPGFHIVKTADPVLVKAGEKVTYTYTVCNDGDYALDGIVVTDDRFPGETIGTVNGLEPEECDGSVTKVVEAPPCDTPGIGLEEGVCEGETRWGTCSWPNIGTATWKGETDDDDECITIREFARIVVVKQTINGDGTFGFTSGTLTPATFTLTTPGLAGEDRRAFADLAPGTYDVAEDPLPPKWSLVSASCDNGDAPAAITVAEGDDVTCTFVNKKTKEFCPEDDECVEDPTVPVGRMDATVEANGDVTATLTWYKSLVDNTYGLNAHGSWGTRGHWFKDLYNSDMAEVAFTNGDGVEVLRFGMDYLTEAAAAPSGYKTLGTGGDGFPPTVGDPAHILAIETSISTNLNQGPQYYQFAQYSADEKSYPVSPALLDPTADVTDPWAPADPQYAGWVYEVTYTVRISAAAFGSSGFGEATTPYAHISPSKTGCDVIVVIPCDEPVPE